MRRLCAAVVQTFLTAHELSVCLHSSAAVFDKCHQKSLTFNDVDKYSLICGAFHQLLNSMLVHRAESVFHFVPVFIAAVKRILSLRTLVHRYFNLYQPSLCEMEVICCRLYVIQFQLFAFSLPLIQNCNAVILTSDCIVWIA